MLFAIFAQPFWSATTDAYIKNDLIWIKKSNKKLINLFFISSVIIIIMLLISNWFFKIWIGDKLLIPTSLSALMAIYFIIRLYSNTYNVFINGFGKLKLQLYIAVSGAVINIPLSIFLAQNLKFGLNGIIMATIFSQIIAAILIPIQYHKIINNKAAGIWNA